jgi:hypothetical protein
MFDIFKQIRTERKDFIENEIEVVPGYTFSQYEAIKKIHLYRSSHFVDGDYYEVNGVKRKKIFDNIVTWRCEVATKMLDIDVKDFVLVGNQENTDLSVYLLEKELKNWLKRSKFGKILNQIVEELPVYGSVVLEKNKNGARVVDLRWLYNDQGAESLDSGRYTVIKDFFTPAELRAMEGKWDNVTELLKRGGTAPRPNYDGQSGASVEENVGVPLFEIFTRYGEVPLSWFTDKESDEEKYVLAKFVVADVDNFMRNDQGVIVDEKGLVLYKEKLKELPLKEVHYARVKGRWLGEGVVEKLFEPQRRRNEIRNQEARAMEIASLILLQTQDQTVANNIFTDVENGQIMTPRSPISKIDTSSVATPLFNAGIQATEQAADRSTFSYDVVRGEATPSSATLGAIQIQEQQAASAFEFKRENVGLFLEEYLKDVVIPQLSKELTKEHVLRLVGSVTELEKARNVYASNWARTQQWDFVLRGEIPPPFEQLKELAMDTQRSVGSKMWVQVAQDEYKDVLKNPDWYVDIVITGENKAVRSQLNNAIILLDKIAAAPQLLTNPVTRSLMFKALSAIGFHISELDQINNETAMAPTALPQGQQPTPQVMQ